MKDFGYGFGRPIFVFLLVLSTGLLWYAALDTEQVQRGYRGTAMQLVTNKNIQADLIKANVVPEALEPIGEEDLVGEKASEIYENVQVLGDLDDARFNRIMAAITEWVSPEQGCAYCHNLENMAEDNYQKVVSRRMFQMTQTINEKWTSHVQNVGVTCYTCHRGNPVPENIWFTVPTERPHILRMDNRGEQNVAGVEANAYSDLPRDPFTPFLLQDKPIRVSGTEALPHGNRSSIKQTEWTWALMMHMSTSLGVNCTYCHNTRNFANWENAPPSRAVAWHGIRMTRNLNQEYLEPLQPVYPPKRLGTLNDAPKANCATCHNGVYKPLYGANMVKDYLHSLAPSAVGKEGGLSTPVGQEINPVPSQDAPYKPKFVPPGQANLKGGAPKVAGEKAIGPKAALTTEPIVKAN
ncbi:MAG: photosynthetic reaction center cytochrome PufC [Pseudomonadota bacterium]